MLNKILFSFIVVILCAQSQVMGGECTKNEILTMLKNGFSKQQIETICKETLTEKDPMCCCVIRGYNNEPISVGYNKDGTLSYTKDSYVEKNKTYKWIKSSECLETSAVYANKNKRNLENKYDKAFLEYDKVISKCVEVEHCGH